MPFQNRVTPQGDLVAVPARGLMMGNRGGMFHDPKSRRLTGRRWASRRWLCCSLHYSGSHRHPVWSRGYTQLFFLDEVTALAAGHRPCAECRRADARAFCEAIAGSAGPIPRLDAVDRRLHEERSSARDRPPHVAGARSLPDGACFLEAGQVYAVRASAALAWSPEGYARPIPLPQGRVAVVTPPTTVDALAAGYAPLWHPTTADSAGAQ